MREITEMSEPVSRARDPYPVELRVAIVFTDIAGSTQLALSLGDRSWWELIDSHDRVIDAEFVCCHGLILKHLGDGCLAVFSTPGEAAEFAVRVISAESARQIPVRAGLHFGSAYVTPTDAVGASVHLASRLADAARPGTILLSEEAGFGLLHAVDDSPIDDVRLRGFDEVVRAQRVDVSCVKPRSSPDSTLSRPVRRRASVRPQKSPPTRPVPAR